MFLLIAALVLFLAMFILVCAFALWKGGWSERAAAIVFVAAVVATQVVAYATHSHFRSPEYGILTVDATHFAALLWIVHRSDKEWVLWAAASQLVATITHFGKILHPSIAMEAYASMQPFWAFPILGAIAYGTFEHRRAMR
jgi:hypothetical protein